MFEARVSAALDLLVARGAGDAAHPGGSLLDDLRRVHHQLGAWGASREVQLAGLCHAFYGTDGFATSLLDLTQRSWLEDAIGSEAEALVYLDASCDRAETYPQLDHAVVTFVDRFTGALTTPDQLSLCAFVEITAANELDVVRNNPRIAAEYGPALDRLFARACRHLSPRAREAWARHAFSTGEGS